MDPTFSLLFFRHSSRYQAQLTNPGGRGFGEGQLVAGVQGALWALGGVPVVLRSDNLSAATHELKTSSGRDLTPRFRAVLEHYGMRSPDHAWPGVKTASPSRRIDA